MSLNTGGSSRASAAHKRPRSRSSSPSSTASKRSPRDVAVFIYRRDLRLDDNTALLKLCDKAASLKLEVVPVFFFNPIQEDKKLNPYCGDACLSFMYESLVDLATQLKDRLVCLNGSDMECLSQLTTSGLIPRVVGYNEDFTPFALQRDENLSDWCAKEGIDVVSSADDYSLLPLDAVVNGKDLPYSVFTPFYNCFMSLHASKVPPVQHWSRDVKKTFLDALEMAPPIKKHVVDLCARCAAVSDVTARMTEHGGRTQAISLMQKIPLSKNYQQERDLITPDKTTHLSPHLKFGTVSSREVWTCAVKSLGASHPFVRQLIWREFYSVILCHHPRLVQGQLNAFAVDKAPRRVNAPFQAKYADYTWKWKAEHFEAFKAGRTGVPLVDAAVRCTTQTGWCHNRCRMVIANFLVKTLSVDWREGEKWFATVAADYDVANNSGGWLWSSGQGADAQPYFRTFNPFRQSERFDPDARYIHEWVPELRVVPPAVIHEWDAYCEGRKKRGSSKAPQVTAAALKAGMSKKDLMKVNYQTDYPAPIVNIRECTQKVIAEFRKYDPK